jgi:hypothetical protein
MRGIFKDIHYVLDSCEGELCGVCNEPATHKVEEVMDRLIEISALKTDYWHELKEKGIKIQHRYDAELDTLFVYFSPKETDRIITHSVDQNVAFLYRHSDKEIVGMRIEAFEKEFLPRIPETRVWKLSDAGVALKGICDIVFAVERLKYVKKLFAVVLEAKKIFAVECRLCQQCSAHRRRI